MSRSKKQNHASPRQAVVLSSQESRCIDIEMSGPLPDPMSYAAYESTTPGAGERILKMAEKEQAHRHQMETSVIAAQTEDLSKERSENMRAQWFAFLVALTMLGVGALLVRSGYPGYGAFISGATIAGVVTAFIRGNTRSLHDIKKEKAPAKK